MKNTGIVLRHIRIGKNYSLKDVSEGILSVSLLSKFERGESDITISKFYLLLERLNVTLDEYSYILNEYQPIDTERLMYSVRTAYENNNIKFLLKLEEKELEKWSKFNLVTYKYNAIMIRALAYDLDKNLEIEEENLSLLSDYLFKVENWGLYEIMLFGNSMSILSIDSIIVLSKEVLNKTELYNDIKKNKEELIRVMLNAIVYCIQENKYSNAYQFIVSTEKLINNTEYYFEKVKMLYLKGIYKVVTGDIEMGNAISQKAIEIMKELGDINVAFNHEEYLNNIV